MPTLLVVDPDVASGLQSFAEELMVKRSSPAYARMAMIIAMVLVPTTSGVTANVEDQGSRDRVPTLTIVDLALIAVGTEDLAGRLVDLRNVRVLRLADTHGFFLDAQAGAVYVLPERLAPAKVAPGDIISIQGAIVKPTSMIPGEINPPLGWNPRIYVMATKITK